jgi:hypothetical protein
MFFGPQKEYMDEMMDKERPGGIAIPLSYRGICAPDWIRTNDRYPMSSAHQKVLHDH